MWLNKIEKYNHPTWLIWTYLDNIVVNDEKTWWIIFECVETWIIIFCFADEVNNIIRMRCLSLWDDWICVNWKCPIDENWNRVCNVQRQINK